MTELDRDRQLRVAAEAGRAPSAHNAQPARFRFAAGGRVEIYEDLRTRLPVADPEARDARIGLGAAFEGLRIALSGQGMRLAEPRFVAEQGGRPDPSSPHLVRVAKAALGEGGEEDPLRDEVFRRRTFRGAFAAMDAEAAGRLRAFLGRQADVTAIHRPEEIAEIAALHDTANWSFLEQPDYHAELYRWMRFSPADPAWHRDGLTTDCMDLSAIERFFLPRVFSPRGFRVLKLLGLARGASSEAKAVRSAAAIAALFTDADTDPFDAGRRLYRLWLEISREGFCLCPMSATAESPAAVERLCERWPELEGSRVVNVLRIGPTPEGGVAESRRLPAEELIV